MKKRFEELLAAGGVVSANCADRMYVFKSSAELSKLSAKATELFTTRETYHEKINQHEFEDLLHNECVESCWVPLDEFDEIRTRVYAAIGPEAEQDPSRREMATMPECNSLLQLALDGISPRVEFKEFDMGKMAKEAELLRHQALIKIRDRLQVILA